MPVLILCSTAAYDPLPSANIYIIGHTSSRYDQNNEQSSGPLCTTSTSKTGGSTAAADTVSPTPHVGINSFLAINSSLKLHTAKFYLFSLLITLLYFAASA